MSEIHQSTSETIHTLRDQLAEAIVAEMQRQNRFPSDRAKIQKSLRDATYHLDYLSVAIEYQTPELFSQYISWVQVLFDGLKFSPRALEQTLEITQKVLSEFLPGEEAALSSEYLAAGTACLSQKPSAPPLIPNNSLPLAGLAKEYLDALLRGDRKAANQLILTASGSGASVQDLYLYVLQPVQYEVGRLWQTHQISIAQEQFSTYVTELIMSQLTPYRLTKEQINRSMVATCVGSEEHALGIRMVADFFELAGWETCVLVASTPPEEVLRTLVERNADLLAISTTMTLHVTEVAQLIQAVRASEPCRHVKILVGGYPFNIAENLWQTVDSDGFGRDAEHALIVANRLVGISE